MTVTVETNNLIPWYLAQVALANWYRDHIGVVLKTLSSLEVHEVKYSLHPLHWLQLWLDSLLVTRARQDEFSHDGFRSKLNVFWRVYLGKSCFIGPCKVLMAWSSLLQSESQTRRSLLVLWIGRSRDNWLYLQMTHMKDCAWDCRGRESRKANNFSGRTENVDQRLLLI